MSIENILITLFEYLEVKKDNVDKASINEAKKRFASALNVYVDWRIDGVMEARAKKFSANSHRIADVLTSNIGGSLAALNSAPMPPKRQLNESELKSWFAAYEKWYNADRKQGMR